MKTYKNKLKKYFNKSGKTGSGFTKIGEILDLLKSKGKTREKIKTKIIKKNNNKQGSIECKVTF